MFRYFLQRRRSFIFWRCTLSNALSSSITPPDLSLRHFRISFKIFSTLQVPNSVRDEVNRILSHKDKTTLCQSSCAPRLNSRLRSSCAIFLVFGSWSTKVLCTEQSAIGKNLNSSHACLTLAALLQIKELFPWKIASVNVPLKVHQRKRTFVYDYIRQHLARGKYWGSARSKEGSLTRNIHRAPRHRVPHPVLVGCRSAAQQWWSTPPPILLTISRPVICSQTLLRTF